MILINKETLEICTASNLKKMYPNISWPHDLTKADLTDTVFTLVDDTPPPTEEGFVARRKKAKQTRSGKFVLQWSIEQVAPMNYSEQRISEYPHLSDFADAFVKQAMHEMNNGKVFVDEMQQYIKRCMDVKDKYPKA